MLTMQRILLTIEEDYVNKDKHQFNVMDFYHSMYRKSFQPNTPGLTSVIGGIRLLSCTGVVALLENGVSFTEKTAKSLSIVTIKTPETYKHRSIPIIVSCINSFCMFAVEHPERLLPRFKQEISYNTLLQHCTTEPIEIDSISTSTVSVKVICKLCNILMTKGYSVGLSVRCKDSTARYGNRFQDVLSESAIECGTQLKINTISTPTEVQNEDSKSKGGIIIPINYNPQG